MPWAVYSRLAFWQFAYIQRCWVLLFHFILASSKKQCIQGCVSPSIRYIFKQICIYSRVCKASANTVYSSLRVWVCGHTVHAWSHTESIVILMLYRMWTWTSNNTFRSDTLIPGRCSVHTLYWPRKWHFFHYLFSAKWCACVYFNIFSLTPKLEWKHNK